MKLRILIPTSSDGKEGWVKDLPWDLPLPQVDAELWFGRGDGRFAKSVQYVDWEIDDPDAPRVTLWCHRGPFSPDLLRLAGFQELQP